MRELLQKRSLALFQELKSSKTEAIFYGADQLEANGPWMLMKQLGFDNLKVLQGGYSFYKTLPLSDSLMKVQAGSWLAENPAINIESFKAGGNQAGSKAEPVADKKAEKVVPVKKSAARGGGC